MPAVGIAMPLAAAFATPGPAIPSFCIAFTRLSSFGGGPSTVIETTASPRKISKPSVLFSSLSSPVSEQQKTKEKNTMLTI
jgi:hypothetical protein